MTQQRVPLRIYTGGRGVPAYAKGGLAEANRTAARGRRGDSKLVHVNQKELEYLESQWGPPTINPETGMPEYFKMKDFFGYAAPVAAVAAPLLFPEYVPELFDNPALNNLLASTVLGAGAGALTGGGSGALRGGALSGIGALAAPYLLNETGITGSTPTVTGLSAAAPAIATGGGSSIANVVPTDGGGMTIGGMGTPTVEATTGTPSSGNLPSSQNQSWWEKFKPNLDKVKGPLMAGGALMALQGMTQGKGQTGAAAAPTGRSSLLDRPIDPVKIARQPIDQSQQDWYTFGTRAGTTQPGGGRFFTGVNDYVNAARGGALSALREQPEGPAPGALPHAGPGFVGLKEPGGDGRSDGVPALLSNDEYVWDSETTALLGDGSPTAGAAKLDEMREIVRREKGTALAKGKISKRAPSALALLRKVK